MSQNNKSKMNIFEFIGIGLTVVVSSGIWRNPISWTDLTGSLSIIAIFFSCLLFFTFGLAYAEVVSIFPKSGGPYSYVSGVLGKKRGTFIGILYYLGYIILGAVLAYNSAKYTLGIFNSDSNIGIILLTVFYTILLCFLSGLSKPKLISTIALSWVAIKILFLLLVAILSFANGDASNFSTTGTSFADFQSVLNSSFLALMGFEVMLIFTEDVDKEDKKIKGNLRISKGILYSIIAIFVLYLFVTFGASSIGGIGSLENGTISEFELISSEIGISVQILSLFAAFSSLGSAFIVFTMLRHILQVMAREKSLPAIFLDEKKTGIFQYNIAIAMITAVIAVIIGIVLTSLLNVTGGAIINIFMAIGFCFILISSYIPIGVIALYLRVKMPILDRPFKSPLYYIVFPIAILLGLYLLFVNISGLF
ncbi:MAG: APC family permease [Promethearchaeota archaeon]